MLNLKCKALFYILNFAVLISRFDLFLICLAGYQSVRLYDASANALRGEFMHGGAVLDCCFHDDSSGFSACADHTVRR